jgi:heme/copper-type cytochrome/quinol oxidase subunit 1
VVYEWLTTVDHKKIGLMYIGYALIFLVIAGVEAMLMRIQLAIPNNHFVSPEVFNQLFTMHGTTMVFFVGMPILFGFGNYLVPLMIGARDMAFPRLNAFSFWVSAFGGLSALLQLCRRQAASTRMGIGARRRLVRLRAAHRKGFLARAQHGLLDAGDFF